MYSDGFYICFGNPLGVSDIPVKSFANIKPDNILSPILSFTLTPCFAGSIPIIRSVINSSNRVGDTVHSYATPGKTSKGLDLRSSSIIELAAHSVIF